MFWNMATRLLREQRSKINAGHLTDFPINASCQCASRRRLRRRRKLARLLRAISNSRIALNCKCGVYAIFVCLSVCMSVCLSVCHLRDMSHKGHVTVAAHHIGKVSQWWLVGQKTRTLMSCNCREGSLRNKNTHLICCVKKLRMAQAQSFRAHTPGGFKFS